MLDKYFSKPLGVDVTPIGIFKPCVELGAGLTAGAGLLGSVLNLFGQSSANDTNLEAVRLNNETQKQLARETNEMNQQQFQQNMKWLREQFYDTGHMRRTVESYQNAGVNPALAYGQPVGASSVGAPSQSQFHVAQTEAGHVQPLMYGDGISESVGHAVDAFYNNQLRRQEVEKAGEDTLSQRLRNMTYFQDFLSNQRKRSAEIEELLSRKDLNDESRNKLKSEKEQIDLSNKIVNATLEEQINHIKRSNDVQDATIDNIIADTAVKRMQEQALDAGIDLTYAQIYGIFEKVKQDWQLVKNDTEMTNASKSEIANRVIHMANQDAAAFEELGISKELVGSQKFRNYLSGAIEGIATGVGAYIGFKSVRPMKRIRGF